MKCPYCSCDMTQGWIQSRDSLYWSDRQRLVPALPPLAGQSVCLSSSESVFGNSVPAYLCPACHKIMIDPSQSLL